MIELNRASWVAEVQKRPLLPPTHIKHILVPICNHSIGQTFCFIVEEEKFIWGQIPPSRGRQE